MGNKTLKNQTRHAGMPGNPSLGELGQDDGCESEVILGHIVRPCLKETDIQTNNSKEPAVSNKATRLTVTLTGSFSLMLLILVLLVLVS